MKAVRIAAIVGLIAGLSGCAGGSGGESACEAALAAYKRIEERVAGAVGLESRTALEVSLEGIADEAENMQGHPAADAVRAYVEATEKNMRVPNEAVVELRTAELIEAGMDLEAECG